MSEVENSGRVTIPVGKTNFNRIKHQTHTITKVLRLEGHRIERGCLQMGDQEIHVSRLDFRARKRGESPLPPPPLQEVSEAAAMS